MLHTVWGRYTKIHWLSLDKQSFLLIAVRFGRGQKVKIKLFLNAKNIVTKKFQNRDVAVSVRKSWCGLFQYKGKLITSNLERTSNPRAQVHLLLTTHRPHTRWRSSWRGRSSSPCLLPSPSSSRFLRSSLLPSSRSSSGWDWRARRCRI